MRSKWGWPMAESIHFLGLSMLVGGWKRESQTFNKLATEASAGQMVLAVAALLLALAADAAAPECVQVTYINPETGGDVQNILGFYALMLRPGQILRLPASLGRGINPSMTIWRNLEGDKDK